MNTNTADFCAVCDAGHLRSHRIDYTVSTSDGNKVVVPNLQVEICDQCGEIMLSAEAAEEVDKAVAAQDEQLTVRELERIREDLGVDQTEMGEIVGLGGKTYHRWEKGNQVPSRSMGYYLRLLQEFPEAFQWLRERGWRRRNRLTNRPAMFDFGKAFPYLARDGVQQSARAKPSFNPATALFGKKE